MLNDNVENDKSIVNYKKRLLIVTLFTAIIFVFLSVYLVFFVIKNNKEFDKIVLNKRQNTYQSKTILSRRGDICDSRGNVLARSIKVYNFIIEPNTLYAYDDDRYLTPTLDIISEYFDMKKSELLDIVSNRKQSKYLRLFRKLSSDEKDNFEKLVEEKNNEYISYKSNYRIKGVWFEEEYKRVYAFDDMLSNVIGFVNDEQDPVMGLELYYDNELRGRDGRSFGYLDSNRDLQSVYNEAKDGYNLYTTIDIDIQRVVEEKIKKWEEDGVGSKKASVIVMDPNDASILAMASNNSFNLNDPRDLSMYYKSDKKDGKASSNNDNKKNSKNINIKYDENEDKNDEVDKEKVSAYLDSLTEEEKKNLLYANWYNNCVQYTYEPGSTSKVFTVASALEEHAVDDDTEFDCKGSITLDDGTHKWTIKCNNRSGHGKLDVKGSITNSCNMAMAEIGEYLGAKNFTKYQEIFGFGKKTNIDLPYEVDTSNLIHNIDNMGRTDLATNAFGQNYNCSMIQMISAYASIINGGNYYEPHFLKKIVTSSGKTIKENEKKLIRKTVSSKTSDFLKNALYETVETGTGRSARVSGLEIGGKTGTAEKYPREDKNYLVSFCGFYPVNKPEKLIYVVIDEPKLEGEAQANARFACELFKEIVEEIR